MPSIFQSRKDLCPVLPDLLRSCPLRGAAWDLEPQGRRVGSPLRLSFSVIMLCSLSACLDSPFSGRNTEWGVLQEPENPKFSDQTPQLRGRVRKVEECSVGLGCLPGSPPFILCFVQPSPSPWLRRVSRGGGSDKGQLALSAWKTPAPALRSGLLAASPSVPGVRGSGIGFDFADGM